MIAALPYVMRADNVHWLLHDAFSRAAPFDPEFDTVETTYCLDAPDLLPTGGLSMKPFGEFSRRRFYVRPNTLKGTFHA